MDFNNDKPIWRQIADVVCKAVVEGTWAAEERVPSVRELGIELQVNPNTVMRAYESLQAEGIIYNRRGIGYFVCADGKEKVEQEQRNQFFKELPALFEQMKRLGVEWSDVERRYREFLEK